MYRQGTSTSVRDVTATIRPDDYADTATSDTERRARQYQRGFQLGIFQAAVYINLSGSWDATYRERDAITGGERIVATAPNFEVLEDTPDADEFIRGLLDGGAKIYDCRPL